MITREKAQDIVHDSVLYGYYQYVYARIPFMRKGIWRVPIHERGTDKRLCVVDVNSVKGEANITPEIMNILGALWSKKYAKEIADKEST